MNRYFHAIAISFYSCALASVQLLASDPPLPAEVQFNRDVRPILSDNCYFCHGPDAKHRQADLRLDIREVAVRLGAIAPGKAKESKLVERIHSTQDDEQMPPPDSHKKLTSRQKAILKLWVEQGAEFQQHWAYERPVKTETPPQQHPIDALVKQRLAEIDMRSSPPAEPRILIRRLYSDLLGMPPTPEEVNAFVRECSDDTGSLSIVRTNTAYLKLVDRVLRNPHYGERMAIGWLDVVRFADTIGYHSDNPRNVWPYRDWVIKSFNDNKPFDRFTIEQIAGDLMPDKTQETLVGSAFNRLLLSTEEGGAQPKDYEARMLTDRVRSIGTAWLGQTTGCAQCHDHKFDPITMRDFYSLGAFFADIEEPIIGRREDGMVLGTEAETAELAKLDALVSEAKSKRDAIIPLLDAAQKQWESDILTYDVTLPELAADSKSSEADKTTAKQVVGILKKESKDRKPKDLTTVETYFRTKATKLYTQERDAVAKAETNRQVYYDKLTKCIVSKSAAKKRTVRLLPRGNWMDESGEMMKPALPGYLSEPNSDGRELTRLDLARWIVSKNNPLTARTVMNRLWRQCFGTGLSKVLDDLGAQGELPPNLPLLDWLACEFMDSGWDMKHMVQTIVTSETYRQVSTATPEQLTVDPDNREYARQGSYRADAELVRDTALSVAGLLSKEIGGPSVKPYQPEGYWENLNFPVRKYSADQGPMQYRRGLYTWWQRSFPHPSMLAFDAPSREECCAERTRSNIPQQALVMLNDPSYVEASRAFAARILSAESNNDKRIAWAWQQALQREPRETERKTMLELIAKHREAYRSDPKAADELLGIGNASNPENADKTELAVWTHVARVLLNLHETITRS
ncbi:MAG: PSD1 and planctomycete cytochrome C domain-containing protein [Pirellula sp.]